MVLRWKATGSAQLNRSTEMHDNISYGAMDPAFSDRTLFPSFFRTVPNQLSHHYAIIQLLKYFGWTWVGIVTSDDDSSLQSSGILKNQLVQNGICVEFYVDFSIQSRCYVKSLRSAGSAIDDDFRITYSVYVAVYAVAHALHKAISNMWEKEETSTKEQVLKRFHHWQLNKYLKDIHFKTRSGEDFSFTENGETPGEFDILNFVVHPDNKMSMSPVGRYHLSSDSGPHLQINESAIVWGKLFTKTPRSVCSERCFPGYRKVTREGQPICCYDCIPCVEGEITNQTDMENCVTCPQHQWSNDRRDKCIPRTIEFLSFQDYLGMGLTFVSISFLSCTLAVLEVFIKFRDTFIVRTNNRNISYILLTSLSLSFLSCLLFIGKPKHLTCMVRQTAFGVTFSVAVSSLLAKAITVTIAFRATTPDSKLKRWVGSRLPIYIVIACALGQTVICLTWLIFSPPFPDYDTQSEKGKMILICNEGSSVAFYVSVSYLGTLALICLVVAFLVRKLPDQFNEAKYITFSMLVFISVWVSFIPSYLSTKGKYMVAVEIFAILVSSAGLLGCIFIPKMYTILCKSECNRIQLLERYVPVIQLPSSIYQTSYPSFSRHQESYVLVIHPASSIYWTSYSSCSRHQEREAWHDSP
ncbi:vomeronasal type-2 receptor 26-like [Rhinophrynus dorsalis]